MTDLITTVREMQVTCADARQKGVIIGFVPTMGALHAGHGALIKQAHLDSQIVVVSIFVNPIQFDRPDDFERYSRNLPEDTGFCSERGVHLLFAPSVGEMYPSAQRPLSRWQAFRRNYADNFGPATFAASQRWWPNF